MSENGFFKDFDALLPEKRIAKLGGENIDITVIPARVALKFIDFSKKYSAESLKTMDNTNFDSGMIDSVLEIVELICARSSSKITKDWLLDNMDIKTLMEFVNFIFEGITNTESDAIEGDSEKNLTSGI